MSAHERAGLSELRPWAASPVHRRTGYEESGDASSTFERNLGARDRPRWIERPRRGDRGRWLTAATGNDRFRPHRSQGAHMRAGNVVQNLVSAGVFGGTRRDLRRPPVQHRREPVMSRPTPRKSSLSGSSPITPPPSTPAPPAPEPAEQARTATPASAAPARPAESVTEPQADATKKRTKYPPKLSFYQDQEDTDRIRGAIMHTIPYEGVRSLSQFLSGAAMKEVERPESQIPTQRRPSLRAARAARGALARPAANAHARAAPARSPHGDHRARRGEDVGLRMAAIRDARRAGHRAREALDGRRGGR